MSTSPSSLASPESDRAFPVPLPAEDPPCPFFVPVYMAGLSVSWPTTTTPLSSSASSTFAATTMASCVAATVRSAVSTSWSASSAVSLAATALSLAEFSTPPLFASWTVESAFPRARSSSPTVSPSSPTAFLPSPASSPRRATPATSPTSNHAMRFAAPDAASLGGRLTATDARFVRMSPKPKCKRCSRRDSLDRGSPTWLCRNCGPKESEQSAGSSDPALLLPAVSTLFEARAAPVEAVPLEAQAHVEGEGEAEMDGSVPSLSAATMSAPARTGLALKNWNARQRKAADKRKATTSDNASNKRARRDPILYPDFTSAKHPSNVIR